MLQFVLVSVNLYKKMVRRQDAMVKLLMDIRDNTTTYQPSPDDDSDKGASKEETPVYNSEAGLDFCYHCGAELPEKVDRCPKCGKEL